MSSKTENFKKAMTLVVKTGGPRLELIILHNLDVKRKRANTILKP